MDFLHKYDFHLPLERVALKPAKSRDSSRLLVYDTSRDRVYFDVFRNLTKYLPPRSALVLNDTRVVPAALTLRKPTGGKVRALLLMNELRPGAKSVQALVDRRVFKGQILGMSKNRHFQIVKQEGRLFKLRPDFPIARLRQLLKTEGATPLPPYLKNSPLTERTRRSRYQSVFSQKDSSVAAPTASLHFTKSLLGRLRTKGFRHIFVTLHVGLGTFSPLSEANFKKKKLHPEYYTVPKSTLVLLRRAKNRKQPVIAVGTTVTRALESSIQNRRSGLTKTELFIFPPYKFRAIDGMITNFHLPRSSLLCLVDAFLRNKKARKNWRELYDLAIQKKFRFYSFGDAMLIL